MIEPIELFIPVRTKNDLNSREHWRSVQKRAKAIKHTASMFIATLGPKAEVIALPCVVKLTRLSMRTMDSDGLAASCKHVRDAIAEWLRLDDGDERVHFQYAQEKCKKSQFGVRVQVFPGMRLVERLEPANDVQADRFRDAARKAEAVLDIAEGGRMMRVADWSGES